MNFSGLINLFTSFYGILGFVFTIILLSQIRQNPKVKWILLAFLGYFLTLYGYTDQWIEVPPPLIEPLQSLRASGRNLSVAFLPLLFIVIFNLHKRIFVKMPKPIFYLVAIQLLITIKTVLGGDTVLGLFLFAAFLAIIFIAYKGVYQWIARDQNFNGFFMFILIVGLLFSIGSFYQYMIDPYPVTFTQNRFLGTTGNPQHAAVILAITIPSIFYFFYKTNNNIKKAGWTLLALFIFYLLYLTGSRTGILMSALGMASIIFGNFKNSIAYIVGIFIIVTFIQITFPDFFDSIFLNEQNQISERLVLDPQQNTRARVWAIQWLQFVNHPLFGAPLNGERIRFAENSWLAAAASVGILGLLFTLAFGASTIRKVVNVRNKRSLEYQALRAGIIILIAGSFTEAYLLGNLSYPLLVLSCYIVGIEMLQRYENDQNLHDIIPPHQLMSYHN